MKSRGALHTSVVVRERVLGEREADNLVPRVVDVVEPREPRVPVDEVEAPSARRAQVPDNQLDPVGVTHNVRIELRPES